MKGKIVLVKSKGVCLAWLYSEERKVRFNIGTNTRVQWRRIKLRYKIVIINGDGKNQTWALWVTSIDDNPSPLNLDFAMPIFPFKQFEWNCQIHLEKSRDFFPARALCMRLLVEIDFLGGCEQSWLGLVFLKKIF